MILIADFLMLLHSTVLAPLLLEAARVTKLGIFYFGPYSQEIEYAPALAAFFKLAARVRFESTTALSHGNQHPPFHTRLPIRL